MIYIIVLFIPIILFRAYWCFLVSFRAKQFVSKNVSKIMLRVVDILFCSFWLKLWQHKVEALTRWYDHDLDVFSKPVEQDILQDLRC